MNEENKLEAYLREIKGEILDRLPPEFLEIETYFQPVVEGPFFHIIGYEALSRPLSGRSIFELLRQARAQKVLPAFDLYCRIKALIKAHEERLGSGELLFINVHPGVLEGKIYPQGITQRLIELLGLSSKQIVLEITEYERPRDTESYLRTIFYFVNQGFRISLDDFGTGCIGYRALLEIEPDFVKLDGYFIRSFLEDPFSQKFVKHIVDVCEALGARIIAEGIEEERVIYPLMDNKINLFQGYYFYRPSPHLWRGGDLNYEKHHQRGLTGTNMAQNLLYF